jgi:hypothetical protein
MRKLPDISQVLEFLFLINEERNAYESEYYFLNTLTASKTHPAIKQSPPSGVIGPRNFQLSMPRILFDASK